MADLMQCLRCGLGYARLPADGRCHACGATVRPVNTDLMQQARELVEKLDSEAASWPTVYASDREIISLLLAAATTIESLRESALRAAPDGFVLVPVEPTQNMKSAASQLFARKPTAKPAEFYRAMLAARPQGVKDGR